MLAVGSMSFEVQSSRFKVQGCFICQSATCSRRMSESAFGDCQLRRQGR
jgi:hypothetical protein